MVNAEVQRFGNENVAGMMRRYSRKLRSAGVVRHVRTLRYHKRAASEAKQKKDALTRIDRTAKYQELYKLGREPQNKRRR